jgi:sec-independent protein translocase protein TatB
MFDIGFSELLVIAVVALLVLGPERLPKAAQFAGLWIRRLRAQWYSVKSEFERDLAADELQRSLRETRESLREAEAQIRSGATAFKTQIEQGFDEAAAAIPPAPIPGPDVAEPVDAASPEADAHQHDAHQHDDDQHGDDQSLESTREGLYEPPPPEDLDDDALDASAAPPPKSGDAHAGR